jgi:branched-chain amino acid transport system permease protein
MSAGIVFSIILLFLVLIGFHVTASQLVGDLLKLPASAKPFGLAPLMIYELIFLAILGTWAGARGAEEARRDTWANALIGGVVAGLITGIAVGLLAFLIGTLDAAKVKMSTYLAQMVPASINLFLLGKQPLQAGVFYLIFFSIAGVAGALLARGVGRGAWRRRMGESSRKTVQGFMQGPAMTKIRDNPASRLILYGLLVLIVFLLPLRLGGYWNYTLGTVGIYVLLGLGLNIVVGMAGLLDLGYVAFFAIGAYTMALLTAPAPHHLLWNFWLVLPLGLVLASLAGILLGVPVLRLRGDYLAIVTLGFGEIIRILSKSDLLNDFSGGPKGVPNIGGPTLFGHPFNTNTDFVYIILMAVILVIFVTRRLQHSRVGRAWVAMREDESVALAMGINTLKHKLLAFAIGAAFAGMGGALFASRNQFTGPEDHVFMVSINVLALVIVGGMGSIPGVIAGAFVLKGLPEMMRELENYRVLAFGALLVIMMIIRPEGLIPSARRRLEIRETDPEAAAASTAAEERQAT